jgi:hypothetical protein
MRPGESAGETQNGLEADDGDVRKTQETSGKVKQAFSTGTPTLA